MATLATTFEDHLHDTEVRWFAVYTKFKCEKVAFKHLQAKGIHAYLPIQKVTKRYTRKVKHLELPLISCYVFVKVAKPHYIPILETEHILEFVKIGRNLIAIPEKEIDILKRIVGEGTPFEIELTRYQVGDRVEIIAGGLTGMAGTLVNIQGEKRFIVELETLGYSLNLQVEPQVLRKTGLI